MLYSLGLIKIYKLIEIYLRPPNSDRKCPSQAMKLDLMQHYEEYK
jgi:hypothetical protein